MTKDILKQVLLFAFFLFLQVLLIDNILLQSAWFINPFIYIGFIILVPVDTPKWLLLISAFLLGYLVDIFGSTPGMHTSATLFAAFMRFYLHRVIIPRDDFQPATIPNVATFGFPWFIRYAAVIVGLHHFMLLLIEDFSFFHLHLVLFKTLVSGFFTLLLLIIGQMFSLGNFKRR